MIDHFGKMELEGLVASEGGPHVSIYFPTHPTAIESEQDPVRLSNLAKQAEGLLVENWMGVVEARDFLAPLTSLVHNESFWMQRQLGIAVFLSHHHFRIYRLGDVLEEKLSISRRYLIRPLVPILKMNAHGFVLALSTKKVNLYEVSEQGIFRVAVPGLPENMEKTLNYSSVDRGQQTHSGASTRQGKHSQVYHGQGGESDSHKEDLRHFFREVDEAVCARLGDSKSPLILACVDASEPLYRQIQAYSELQKEHISGNVDYLGLDELRKKALPILQSEFETKREAQAHTIREHLNTSVASDKISEVIQASYQGRIRVLFFDKQVTIEGRFDPTLQLPVAHAEGAMIEFSPYNTDLVESAIEQTIRHRGDVYSVSKLEMPGSGPLAALFRY
jgi:hypothetical protein